MAKPHLIELRSRVIAFVEEGHGHREAARHFRVSPRFVNDTVILKRASAALVPKLQGNHDEGKRAPFSGWLRERLAVKGEPYARRDRGRNGQSAWRDSASRFGQAMAAPAWSQPKKTLLASEILRPDIAERRRVWVEIHQPA